MKQIVKFGTTTNTSGETISEPSNSSTTGAPSWSISKSAFSKMIVVLDVKTVTGTSITFSIQESYGGIFAETAKSTAITTAGKYVLVVEVAPASAAANNQGPFPAMGSGTNKQVVTTANTLSALNADIYFCFYN